MGRLFLHLREEKGYTYGASSALDARQHRGDWTASTNVRTEVTEPALRDLLEEVRQLREIPVSDQDWPTRSDRWWRHSRSRSSRPHSC